MFINKEKNKKKGYFHNSNVRDFKIGCLVFIIFLSLGIVF